MISEYRETNHSEISSEEGEESSHSLASDKEQAARDKRTVSDQIKDEIRLFTDQLLSKREEQFLACLERIDKSLQAIQLNMRPATGKKTDQPAVSSQNPAAPAEPRKRSTSEPPDYRAYKGLPIPLLTAERDYKKWFSLYEQLMATKDEEILKHALVYYLDEDVLDLYVELSAKTYKNIKRSLNEKIQEFFDE